MGLLNATHILSNSGVSASPSAKQVIKSFNSVSSTSRVLGSATFIDVLKIAPTQTFSGLFSFVGKLESVVSSGSASMTVASTTGRTCTVTGKVPNNVSGATITAYLKTWNKNVINPHTNVSISGSFINILSDQLGNFTLVLTPPGDLYPNNLYYIININGQIYTTTSFDYFADVQDISFILQAFPSPITALMYGRIKTSGFTGIKGAPIEITVDRACVDLATGVEILPSQKFTAITDQNGFYKVSLIPTPNLVPYGRFYVIKENNSTNYKYITVPSQGGFIDDNIIDPTSDVGGYNYPINLIPAQINETSTFVSSPASIYDDVTNIRAEIANLFNQPWNSLKYNPIPSLAKIGSNEGYAYINGQFQVNNSLIVNSITSTNTANFINIRSESGEGSVLLPDSFGTTLYGLVSWESGVGTLISGIQADVYFTTGISGSGFISSSLSPGDAGMANQWINTNPYSYVQTINAIAGQYVLHIGFTNAPLMETTYKIFYKIRGI